MEQQPKPDFIPLTPAALAILRELETQKQSVLRGFLAAHGVISGSWEIAQDGSGLVQKDQ